MLHMEGRSRSVPLQGPRRGEEGGGGATRRVRDEIADRLPGEEWTGGALAAALAAAGGKAVERWVRRRRPSLGRLIRGAAAGAGAAGIVHLARHLLHEGGEADLTDELLAGAGKGLAYAAVLEPFLPGPPALRGALVGTLEYLTVPWGGALSRLQNLSPARKLPIVGVLLEAGDAEDDPYLAFLLYGLALGLLYGEGELD
jgi:hypothetical protein